MQEDPTMPPPKKLFRVGTQECNEAVRSGTIQLSLPELECEEEEEEVANVKTSFVAIGVHECNENQRQLGCQVVVSTEEDKDKDEDVASENTSEQGQHTSEDVQCSHSHSRGNENGSEDDGNNGTTMSDNRQGCSLNAVPKYQLPDPSLPRFCDIIGHGAVKLRIDEVLLPLALPTSVASSILTGVRSMPASILFYGPPGVGKTKLARAIAGEAEAAFISVGPSDILSKYVGESESAVRELFKKAYEQARRMESQCAVLFFDEIDAVGQSRGDGEQNVQGGGDSCSRRVLAELLIQLTTLTNPRCDESADLDAEQGEDEEYHRGDYGRAEMAPGSESNENDRGATTSSSESNNNVRVVVVAATNRPSDCDPALLRRFGIRVHVGLPTLYDRHRILKHLLKDIAHTITRVELKDLAMALEGWSGSELESLAREACMAPVRESIRVVARKKRRTRYFEQTVGDYSGQNEDASRAQAIQAFQNLRSVTLADFEAAIEFWSGNQDTGHSGSLVREGSRSKNVHYDSSSSSEEDN